MAINKYRYVGDDRHYCSIFECLACGGRYCGHQPEWAFCPLCGTRWDGKHECRTADLDGRYDVPQMHATLHWFLEGRSTWIYRDGREEVLRDWHHVTTFGSHMTRADILRTVRSYRFEQEDDGLIDRWCRSEYRIRATPKDNPPRIP